MKDIQVRILNPGAVAEAERMMVAMARLTQKGHAVTNAADLTKLLNKPYTEKTVRDMCALPHPTIQKFGLINVAVIGASRRFLAQITRHQNEVKFMSASLQYSDYSGMGQFVVPYEITEKDEERQDFAQYVENYHTTQFINSVSLSMRDYEKAIEAGVGNDTAGYMMPQALRNVLVISALPYELKHMIRQRTCRRNTAETRYVMLRVWEELYQLGVMFEDCGPACMSGKCPEGKMSCGQRITQSTPTDILRHDFKYYYKEE